MKESELNNVVPVKLSLSNFMSYKKADLDLTGVHLACLSGDNGAGKSSLFDAMTWAMWGEARADVADDLISQGQFEMRVDFEFMVGNQLYRIDRRRNRKGAGQTLLNFFIRSGDDWTKITQNNVRATQEHVIEVLHMRYETFVNSAFLKQGKADEFTIKTARERKQVLADILGLSQYDDLEKKAKEQAKDADISLKQTKGRLEEIKLELDKRPRYEAQRDEARLQWQELQEQLFGLRQNLQDLRGDEVRLKIKEDELKQAASQLAEIQRQVRQLEQEQGEARQILSESQNILKKREEIEQGFLTLHKTNEELEALNFKAQRDTELQRQAMRLESAINKEKAQIEASIKAARTTIEQYQKLSASRAEVEADIAEMRQQLELSTAAGEELSRKQADLQTREAESKAGRTEGERLKIELAKIETKAKSMPKPGDTCDRCGTHMTAEACDQTLTQYREEYKNKQKEYKDCQKNNENLKSELEELKLRVIELEPVAKRRSLLEREAGIKQERLGNIEKAGSEMAAQQAMLDSLMVDLNGKQYALNDQRKLSDIQGEIAALAYDQQQHKAIRLKQGELKKFEEQKARLREAEKDEARATKDLKRLAETEKRLRDDETNYREKLARLQKETAGLAQLRERIRAEQQQISEIEGQEKMLNRNLANAEAAIENCDALEVKQQEQQQERDRAAQAKDLYAELAEAFGKKGLQALVIDTALPELEEEANQLLGRMSDGRMSVRFDTQRDSKKGEAIETLDLRISDEQGSRPYELFSGGEAFRVNFAVRVALSKLLARRSGAQLRTLIIDEGFGSQDGQGRERLVEAIRSIESDFERVLVITHLQELKDVFPVRIDVVKTAEGSTVTIN